MAGAAGTGAPGGAEPEAFREFAGTYETVSAAATPWGSCGTPGEPLREDEWSRIFRLRLSPDGADLHRLECTTETQCAPNDLYYPYFDEVLSDGRLRDLIVNTASSATECCFTADAWELHDGDSAGQIRITRTISSLCMPLDDEPCTPEAGTARYDTEAFECRERTEISAERLD